LQRLLNQRRLGDHLNLLLLHGFLFALCVGRALARPERAASPPSGRGNSARAWRGAGARLEKFGDVAGDAGKVSRDLHAQTKGEFCHERELDKQKSGDVR